MKPASTESEPHWSDKIKDLPYGEIEQFAIRELVCRPWFERLWIQQEILLANRHAICMCGSDIIAWQCLRKAFFCLVAKMIWHGDDGLIHGLSSRLSIAYKLGCGTSTGSFLTIMDQTRECRYLDPRDRIYAVLSLLDESEVFADIEPDYGEEVSRIYHDTTLHYIARTRHVEILRSSRLKDKSSKMPTWVPDWRVENPTYVLRKALADGFSRSIVQYKGPDVLCITGICSATIQQVISVRNSDYKTTIAAIHKSAPKNTLQGSYIGGEILLIAYCHTICASRFNEAFLPPRNDMPQVQQSLDFLSLVLSSTSQQIIKNDPTPEASKFISSVCYCFYGRTFIQTREGYIGLAPRTARPGDHVCILLGCSTPMLLRPARKNQFRVVGECYTHGLMSGKALLGPLPDPYRTILTLDKTTKRYSPGFQDQRTGEVQRNDPRIEPRPNDEDDRVLTSEMIEARGVNLRTFDLI